MIPQLWLLAKQRTWTAGIPRYIPNSGVDFFKHVNKSKMIHLNLLLLPFIIILCLCFQCGVGFAVQQVNLAYTTSLLRKPFTVTADLSFFCLTADVILDPMTNHPWLLLSDDQRKVQEGHTESDPPNSSQRFDSWPCVLAWEGYGSGRHYWEVDIANKGYWRIGLTSADSKRIGRFPMTPKQGYWVLWRSTNQFYACSKPETLLPIGLVPRRIGIYLDYEEGQISFYNAETKSHIYTFTGSFREKLYPLFAPMDGRTLMTIIQPHKIAAK